MSGEEVLLTLGEVAIAVAGFSSIVAVFGRRTERPWSPVESFRLATLIANAVGPALLAFVPFALLNLHLSPRTVWGLSSAALVAFVVAQTFWVFSKGRQRFSESGEPIRLWVAVSANSLSLIAVVLQILNIIGLWFHRELGPFLMGLLLILCIAVIQFCVLIFSPPSAEPPAP